MATEKSVPQPKDNPPPKDKPKKTEVGFINPDFKKKSTGSIKEIL